MDDKTEQSRERRADLLHRAGNRAEAAGDQNQADELHASVHKVRDQIRRGWRGLN